MGFFRKIRSFFVTSYRVIWSSIYAFNHNNDYLKASALTFYTLVSIVPFFAVAFGIASGFGFENYLKTQLEEAFKEQKEVVAYVIKFSQSMLQNTRGGLIAGIGVITLLWTNLSMLGNIENALNQIWKVRQPRTWAKKFSDYLAAMIICPLFLVVSSSLSLYLITQVTETAKESRLIEIVSPYLLYLLKLIPFLLSILLFIVIYLFIPNVKVRSRSRIFAGVLAGIAFQLWQWIYIHFQVQISSYGAIYGTFAALPLFLIWLQVSWLIVLAGAEIAAHIENEMSYTKTEGESLEEVSEKKLGLLVLTKCIHAFSTGARPLTTMQIAKELSISLLSARQIIDLLEQGNLLAEVSIEGNVGYLPCCDPRLLTIKNVTTTIEKQLVRQVQVEHSLTLDKISSCLAELDQAAEHAPANMTMEELNQFSV